MCRNWCEYRYDAIELSKFHVCFWILLSHRDKEMWVVPRLVKGTVEYRSPVCRARICRKSPLIFQHPSFILARRNNRHHFRVSSRMMAMPPGYTKVFGFAPTWCTKKSRNECCGFFVAPFPPGRTHTSRKRSCSSRGDWSLKMVAGL